MQDNLKQLLLLITQLSNEQAVTTVKGEYKSTPNIVIHNSPNTTIKIGKFYRPQNDDSFFGIEIIKGKDSKVGVLYKIDRERLPRGFTLTRTDVDEEPQYIDIK